MNRLLSSAGLGFVIATCIATSALAKGPPTSAEQLRSEIESALKAKNTEDLIALFNWEGIQEKAGVKMSVKAAYAEMWKTTNGVISVKLSPLPAHYSATNEIFSLRTRANVSVVGMIDINRTDKDYDEHLPYGTKDGVFYIAQTVRETIPGKSLRVTVSVFAPPITYTGSCVYVEEGREINFDLNGTNKYIEKNFWGDYIKSCTIQKTTTTGLIMLEIAEDHKKIFQSPQVKTEDPILFTGKPPTARPASAQPLPNEKEIALQEKKDRERELPVWTSFRVGDDCIPVLHNYATKSLSLTVTAIKEASQWATKVTFQRTNSCQVDLAAGESKDLDLLQGWILTPDDRVRIEIVNPKYDIGRSWIMGCRTPSHKIAERQEAISKEFNQTTTQAAKDNDAQILSDLWRAGLLKDEIKEQLVQEHYQFVLQQIPSKDGIPSWIVKCHQTFPFPNVYTAFTPTLFANNQVNWSPGESQTSCDMSATNVVIASMTGGDFKNEDVLQCKVDLSQTGNGQSWQKSLWSNKIVLQGLMR